MDYCNGIRADLAPPILEVCKMSSLPSPVVNEYIKMLINHILRQYRSEGCSRGAMKQGTTQEWAEILRRNDLIIRLKTNNFFLKYEISIINEINVIKLNNNK